MKNVGAFHGSVGRRCLGTACFLWRFVCALRPRLDDGEKCEDHPKSQEPQPSAGFWSGSRPESSERRPRVGETVSLAKCGFVGRGELSSGECRQRWKEARHRRLRNLGLREEVSQCFAQPATGADTSVRLRMLPRGQPFGGRSGILDAPAMDRPISPLESLHDLIVANERHDLSTD